MPNDFVIGDKVYLISGSPQMTVIAIRENTVIAMYYSEIAQAFKQESFPKEALKKPS